MFITTPSFEERVPKGIAVPESRYWQAVLLSNDAPWYLLAHTVEEPGYPPVTQTLAISWELVLRDVLEAIGTSSVVSLGCVTCADGDPGDWTLRPINELWAAALEEVTETGPLLMRYEGEDVLRDWFQEVVSDEYEGRELLLSFASSRTSPAAS
jgi:hypothetical protein